jgi:hypothetical protein
MSAVVTNKNAKVALLKELDDLIMEGWSEDMDLGTLLDSMPGDLRNFMLNMQFTNIIPNEDGFTITLKR